MYSYHKIFLYLKYISFTFYILLKVGILEKEPYFVYLLEDFIKIFIAVFCIYLFWPFRKKYQVGEHDRAFAFSAGLFLLTSLDIFKNNSYIKIFKKLFDIAE